MKTILVLLSIASIFPKYEISTNTNLYLFQINQNHDNTSKDFIFKLLEKDYKGCWLIFDKKTRKEIGYKQFVSFGENVLSSIGKLKEDVVLNEVVYSTDIKGNEKIKYTYILLSDKKSLKLIFTYYNIKNSKILAVQVK